MGGSSHALSIGVVDDHIQMDFTAKTNGPMKDIDPGHVAGLDRDSCVLGLIKPRGKCELGMASSNEFGIGEMQEYQVPFDEGFYSTEEVISVIRGTHEDFDLLGNLISDEDVVIEALLELLQRIILPVSSVPVDSSVLPMMMGQVEEAHIVSDGKLVFSLGGGEILYRDLFEVRNRDLLVEVIEDIMPKLKDYISRIDEFAEPVEEVPEPEPVLPELPDFEEALPEPLVQERAYEEELVFEEPEIMDVPEEAADIEQIPPLEESLEPGLITEPEVLEPSLPKEPVITEPSLIIHPPAEVGPKDRAVKVGEYGLRRLRRTVEIERDRTKRRMAELRKMRDYELMRLRGVIGEERGFEMRKREGLLSKARDLLSRLRGRKRERLWN